MVTGMTTRMRYGRIGLISVLLAALFLIGCDRRTSLVASTGANTETAPADGDGTRPNLPNFAMKTLDGNTWELAKHGGKVVMVNFWATWCPPCRAEMPDLVALSKKYKSAGLETAGVSIDIDGAKKVGPFVKKHGIPYPILLPNLDDPLLQSVPNVPVTLLLDRQGRIAYKLVGARPRAAIEPLIQGLLTER